MENRDDLTPKDETPHETGITAEAERLDVNWQKNKKKILPFVGISVILIAGLLFYVLAWDKLFRDYAIKVNSQIIEKDEYNKIFDNEMEKVREFLKNQPKEIDPKGEEFKKIESETKKRIVDQLSVRLLLLDEAIKEGYNAKDSEIETEINNLKTKMGNEKFNEILKKEKLTIDYIKSDFQKQIIVQKYLKERMNKTTVDDKEAEDFFNKNKDKFQQPEMIMASHILLKSEEEAKNILKKLKEGANFEKLAEEHSIDPSAKFNKGNLNFFPRGAMVPEFEKVAFSLPVEKLSGIL